MKNIANLHYISAGETAQQQLNAIEEAIQAGCQCVQLRFKQPEEPILLQTAQKAAKLCKENEVTLIINDHPHIALEVQAQGVHLGKEDMPPRQARTLLGTRAIIGGTANRWEDITRLAEQQVNYIGLGPFRFTKTKKKLSPILGLEGYQSLLQKMQKANINIPIIAIGGIKVADIASILQTGVHGIAVASLINQAKDKTAVIQAIKKALASKID